MLRQRNFAEAMKHRRSYYSLSNSSPVQDEVIIHIIRTVVKYAPSSFNSQSTRIVLLLGDEHRKLWDIVKQTLRQREASPEALEKTDEKIERCFASGYGTILYYDDTTIVKDLQDSFPHYKERFPIWSQQASAMDQFAIWTMLEDVGFGASLQHYDPLIDDEVRRTWKLPDTWKLIAEMPFGTPIGDPHEKEDIEPSEHIKVFR
ncbi:MAG: nitroreductase family protein [Prevotellaceae bacterium]|jgi:predicted oxidoreductase (fatty acid repression mutant protein)|nr:nitroreductase family protein [Prevotellaceae bacterium]